MVTKIKRRAAIAISVQLLVIERTRNKFVEIKADAECYLIN